MAVRESHPFEPAIYKRTQPLAKGETRRRNEDLDPQILWKGATLRLTRTQMEQLNETGQLEIDDAQLVWRGKDQLDWSDLVVQTPPLYTQEKIHPQSIIENLKRQTGERQAATDFYRHNQNWQNRMILGDSLQVMASLAEREALRGQVQCIYFDPPYGIRFNSNWQVSTRSRDVKDGKLEEITREPEQVKAFRDTWKDGIHSYLTCLRDRLTAMRDLLTESGSIFVQIGDENVHRVRMLMDEVFGEHNYFSLVSCPTSISLGSVGLDNVNNYIAWYGKNKEKTKIRSLYCQLEMGKVGATRYKKIKSADGSIFNISSISPEEEAQKLEEGAKYFTDQGLTSRTGSTITQTPFKFQKKEYKPTSGGWRTSIQGLRRVSRAHRILKTKSKLRFQKNFDDFGEIALTNNWTGFSGGIQSRMDPKIYAVQTATGIIQRCILMATDPGDLVLDPTCGAGTTAYVAEQWGRRWITIDTSRVALALARARLMGARYPWYLLADSPEGCAREQEITGKLLPRTPTHGDIRQGFVYQRVPHITLKSIAHNEEIDVIWETYQEKLEPLRQTLNEAMGKSWEEWEIPREAIKDWPPAARDAHQAWWKQRIARQQEIDASIARRADIELLYDRPYEETKSVRVTGPFTVESLFPHWLAGASQHTASDDFALMVVEHLKQAGIHQSARDERITFTSVEFFPGDCISAEGRFTEGTFDRRAAILIGPEFGTITRADLLAAAKEAYAASFDLLIACGFHFDAHSSALNKLGPLPILQARINPDLHMSEELKNTGEGNLFVVFGEPDIQWGFDGTGRIIVKILGVDVFDPGRGAIRSGDKDDIAAWFIDTDYNGESFFVRHAYFLGANDPYKALKTSLRAEIDREAWKTLFSDTSQPFPKPATGRFAVKVINHFGDEVMKLFET